MLPTPKGLEALVSESLNVPAREPVFVIVTSPLRTSPGFRLEPVTMATPLREFDCSRVPEANVLAGLALWELKSAPEPTTAAAATMTVSRPARARPGLRNR